MGQLSSFEGWPIRFSRRGSQFLFTIGYLSGYVSKKDPNFQA